MRQAKLEEIRELARKYHSEGIKWHFHILTPTCSLNESEQYAFILEGPEQSEVLVYYSDQAEKELGQELSPLLHGAKVLSQDTTDTDYTPSETIKKIIERAKSLNERGAEWHHHVLFPNCRFNENSPSYTLVFEDPEIHEILESLSEEEPTNDLKQIEGLFYNK